MKTSSKTLKNQSTKITLSSTAFMLKRCCCEKNGKVYIFFQSIVSLLNVMPTIVSVLIPGLILNELVGNKRINVLSVYVGIAIITPLVHQVINSILTKRLATINFGLTVKLKKDFNEYVADMDYETLENPEIQTLRTRVRGTFIQPLNTANKVINLISTIVSFLSISAIIATLNPIIIVVVSSVVLANSLITKKLNIIQYLNGKEISRCDRALLPFQGILVQLVYAKEIRLFNLKEYFANIILKREQEINEYRLKDVCNQNVANLGYSLMNLLQNIFMYIYLIYQVLFNSLPIGNMTIYMSSIAQFSGLLSSIFNAYTELSKDSLNIQEMIHFFEISQPTQNFGCETPILNADSTIEFKNVFFKYPGAENYAINNLNIKIEFKNRICIVGENGSGKTTFVNLLTRLYAPTKGEILLNNRNINEYDLTKYQELFSTVLQDFCLYELPLSDNIILANINNYYLLNDVLKKTGLDLMVKDLPQKHNTTLGKMADPEGIIPSGGEAQKIAIARALYRDSPIMILDEPTAALDPLSEYEIYMQFHQMIEEKTAILITHRLSAVQLSDLVIVFRNGQAIEYGTHKELYTQDGVYTEMFNKQAQFYRDNSNE